MFQDTRSTPLAAVTVNCLLSKNEDLTTVGAALASNIARFKVTCTFSTIHITQVQYSDKTSSDTLKRPMRFFVRKNIMIGDLQCSSGVNFFIGLSKRLDLKFTPSFQRIQIIRKFLSITKLENEGQLSCEQALLFKRAKRAARERVRTRERAASGRGKESLQ